jgi:hypothetical protein
MMTMDMVMTSITMTKTTGDDDDEKKAVSLGLKWQ